MKTSRYVSRSRAVAIDEMNYVGRHTDLACDDR
ncbi:hypothetical protein J2T57_002570 [Natronocella acetinitrilica]|uniref:Uncharacterized protein n=1 Tax=Natronocella acetinitrilica TaxID=414046 RepID=A0AAE3G425_9GAMM|nr:hypothetical protein [Natronocella acetinitrilica]